MAWVKTAKEGLIAVTSFDFREDWTRINRIGQDWTVLDSIGQYWTRIIRI